MKGKGWGRGRWVEENFGEQMPDTVLHLIVLFMLTTFVGRKSFIRLALYIHNVAFSGKGDD